MQREHVLIINEAHGIAAVFAAGFVTPVNFDEEHVPDEGSRSGYMEFFDWLAGCSDTELLTLHKDLLGGETGPKVCLEDPKLRAIARESMGLKIWQAM